jgi:methylated-DNA-protein-cysteine methyltransferase-like protein
MTDPNRERQIVDVIRALSPGEVVTYGDIAEDAGHPRQSRLVGRILATTTEDLPWWRVVDARVASSPGRATSGSAAAGRGRDGS